MIAAGHLPDYDMAEVPGDLIRFSLQGQMVEAAPPVLSPEAHDAARALLPGADVHALEAEWRGVWARSGAPRLRKPDAAFVGWIRKRRAGADSG
jgi:hypothetical protein